MSDQPYPERSERALRSERNFLMARYDSGAIPHSILRTIRQIDAEIAEFERTRLTQNGPRLSPGVSEAP